MRINLEIHTYLCSLLDGCSRFIIHWEIRQTMTEVDVETIIQRVRERFPGGHPRIISDNGPQFIAKDFKEFIRICGMTHVRTSQGASAMNIAGLDEARVAKERAKVIFADLSSVVGIGITRVGDRYGVKANLDAPPRPTPNFPRRSTASPSESSWSGRFASADRIGRPVKTGGNQTSLRSGC